MQARTWAVDGRGILFSQLAEFRIVLTCWQVSPGASLPEANVELLCNHLYLRRNGSFAEISFSLLGISIQYCTIIDLHLYH